MRGAVWSGAQMAHGHIWICLALGSHGNGLPFASQKRRPFDVSKDAKRTPLKVGMVRVAQAEQARVGSSSSAFQHIPTKGNPYDPERQVADTAIQSGPVDPAQGERADPCMQPALAGDPQSRVGRGWRWLTGDFDQGACVES